MSCMIVPGALGSVTALGGRPCRRLPDPYGEFDYLHIGEFGDGTDPLIESLDQPAVAFGHRGKLPSMFLAHGPAGYQGRANRNRCSASDSCPTI